MAVPDVVVLVNLIPHSGRRYGTDTSRQRQDHARRPSSDTAIEGFDRRARRSLRSNPKTVTKWRKRPFVHDAAMGPKAPHSTVLSAKEEALAVAFRKHTLLPLDDCLYALQATIPHLTRHRCIACSSATPSAGCLRSKARQSSKRRSSATRSATSTSTSPKCAPEKANSICSLLSIELRSLRCAAP